MTEKTSTGQLVYVADPMCSWCWGFAPVMAALARDYGDRLPIQLIMGGLRPGTTEPMAAAQKATVREHWQHVLEATGQPFDFGLFDREDFIYDTEPAARAVVVVRRLAPALALSYLERVQAAFYAEGRDVTRPDILADLAGEAGIAATDFLENFQSDAAIVETQADFASARSAGITGFPTLIVGPGADQRYRMLTQGYQPIERITPRIEHWLQISPAA